MWKNTAESGRPQMTIWRTRIAWWITKATNTRSEYVILIAFPLQQWLYERASMLRYMYIACVIVLFVYTTNSYQAEGTCYITMRKISVRNRFKKTNDINIFLGVCSETGFFFKRYYVLRAVLQQTKSPATSRHVDLQLNNLHFLDCFTLRTKTQRSLKCP